MSIVKEQSYGEGKEYEVKPVDGHDSEQHRYQNEEGGPVCYMGKSSEGGWRRRVTEAKTAGVKRSNGKDKRQR